MKKSIVLFLVTLFTFVTLNTAAQAKDMAKVYGKSITSNDVEEFIKANGINADTPGVNMPQLRKNVLDVLIKKQVLLYNAEQMNLRKTSEYRNKLKMIEKEVVSSLYLDRMADKEITESAVKKLYNEKFKDVTEYNASHILVKDKNTAKKVIRELKRRGVKHFADLAKKYSTGPSKNAGGLLGWVTPAQLVPTFSNVMVQLGDGHYTKTPVKTRFGWHVIYVKKHRKKSAPAYNKVKAQIKAQMVKQFKAKKVNDLYQSASGANQIIKY